MIFFKKGFIVLSILLFISSCTVSMPMSSNYYNNGKKVGIIYLIDSIGVYKEGPQGLLDMALTAGERFKKPLLVVDKKINPTNKIKSLYQDMFSEKGKSYQIIDFDYNTKELKKFSKPSGSNKKFHKYNLQFLKEKGVDELLIVNVRYGLLVSYYGMIETGKMGNCRIDSEIINLDDNSIIFKDISDSSEKINGKWKTPPDYENLSNSIFSSIEKCIELKKSKLNK